MTNQNKIIIGVIILVIIFGAVYFYSDTQETKKCKEKCRMVSGNLLWSLCESDNNQCDYSKLFRSGQECIEYCKK